jgi:hypothetical protein
MSLIKRYSNHSLEQLIVILESGDDYTEEAKDAIRTILEFKNPSDDEVREIAFEYWGQKINDSIKSILLNNEKPVSQIISEAEMKAILVSAFEKYSETQHLFEIDTTKYWFV